MTSLTIVTPWHNHRELERDYWAAVRDADAEVLVIDNGSEPPLPNGWRLAENHGFSHACNVGLELARTDAVLFLNNDVRMTERGWLEPIRDALELGVLVGEVRYDPHSEVDGVAYPYLDGWCLAGMRDDLLELGGFDETLAEPAYWSDNLLSLEARALGMTLFPVKIGLQHLGNYSSAADPETRATASAANRMRFTSRARQLQEEAVAA